MPAGMEYFYQLFHGLPRGGPGDNSSTRRAWRMMTGVPPAPEILDVGCGPGMQTLELASLSKGRVTALTTVEDNLAIIGRTGFRPIGHFVLPRRSWLDDFYDPMEKRLVELRPKSTGNAEALKVFETMQNEAGIFREYSGYYGYAFFIMRKE